MHITMKKHLLPLAAVAIALLSAASCDLTIPVTGVSVSPISLVLTEGQEAPLNATVVPEDATDKSVTWSSSSPAVADVQDGVVSALSPGTAMITVRTSDGGFTARCEVTVNKLTVHVTGVSLAKTELQLQTGDSETLTYFIAPADADDNSVAWSTDNPDAVTVDNTGKVTAVAPGQATVTVKTNDGGFTDQCLVKVTGVPVTGVGLDATTMELGIGEEKALTATVYPDNAYNKSLIWTSENDDIATVSEAGVVKGVAGGHTNIVVTTVDGGFTATCAVTVSAPSVPFVKMSVEKLADMNDPRADLGLFVTTDGEIVAVGGHTTNFNILSSAEYYKDGVWTALPSMKASHDMPFTVALPDGRFLIGGGCPSGNGVDQEANVDVFNPASHSFAQFPNLSVARTLSHAIAFNGHVLVSGNWYADDSIEIWSEEGNNFTYVKTVSQARHNPYIFRTAVNNAIVFGTNPNYGGSYDEIIIDRYDGDSFQVKLFESWLPMGLGSNWRPADCWIGETDNDYRYLMMVYNKDSRQNQGGAVALVNGEDISLLPTDYTIPDKCDFGNVYFAGPVVVDKSKKVGYAFGSNGEEDATVCYILKIDYADIAAGGTAKLTMYYTDLVESFPGAGYQSGIVLMPDGRLMVAGGIYDSNFRPFNSAFAFKPF